MEDYKVNIASLYKFARKAAKMDQDTMIQLSVKDLKAIQEDIKSDLRKWYNSFENKLDNIGSQQDKIIETTTALSNRADTIQTAVKEIDSQVGKVNDATTKFVNNPTPYRDTLVKGMDGVLRESAETRVRIDVERKAKQILIVIKDFDTAFLEPDALLNKVNKVIGEIEDSDRLEKVQVDFITKFPNGGALLHLNSKEAADWLKDPNVEDTFLKAFSKDAYVKECSYSILLRGVPIIFDPSSEEHLWDIEEENGLRKFSILKARWIKPEARRRNGQTHAHATAAIGSVETANSIIKEGLLICGVRIRPEKLKREPLQCLRCRRWGHFAANCYEKDEACGTCGEAHRTTLCKNNDKKYCVSCKVNTHASWDRECPEFLKRSKQIDDKYPENNMVYFPTTESWMLTTRPDRIPLEERFPQRFTVNNIPATIKKTNTKGKKQALTKQITDKNTPGKEQSTIQQYFSQSQAKGKDKEPSQEEGELQDEEDYEECFNNMESNAVERLMGSISL